MWRKWAHLFKAWMKMSWWKSQISFQMTESCSKHFSGGSKPIFLKDALKTLERYSIHFSEELLLLSLYGEECVTCVVSGILLNKDWTNIYPNKHKIDSTVHGVKNDVNDFIRFLMERVDVPFQLSNHHIQRIDKKDLKMLSG